MKKINNPLSIYNFYQDTIYCINCTLKNLSRPCWFAIAEHPHIGDINYCFYRGFYQIGRYTSKNYKYSTIAVNKNNVLKKKDNL